MIDAGARILEVACGPCIGMGQAPPSEGVSVRTFNRNFPGRSGTTDAKVYLSGPQVAVAAALTGRLGHPRDLGTPPEIKVPASFDIDDSMIIPPPKNGKDISIRTGPNIRPLPDLQPLPDALEVKVLLKLDDNITTDDILPGGAKVLPLRSNLPEISKHVYALKSPGFANKAREENDIAIVGGQNYGQGSSREHAALAPRYLGVRVILAESFARLHRANLINFGVLPLLIKKAQYNSIRENDHIEVSNLHKALKKNEPVFLKSKNCGLELQLEPDFSKREREILLVGGQLNVIRNRLRGKE